MKITTELQVILAGYNITFRRSTFLVEASARMVHQDFPKKAAGVTSAQWAFRGGCPRRNSWRIIPIG